MIKHFVLVCKNCFKKSNKTEIGEATIHSVPVGIDSFHLVLRCLKCDTIEHFTVDSKTEITRKKAHLLKERERIKEKLRKKTLN